MFHVEQPHAFHEYYHPHRSHKKSATNDCFIENSTPLAKKLSARTIQNHENQNVKQITTLN